MASTHVHVRVCGLVRLLLTGSGCLGEHRQGMSWQLLRDACTNNAVATSVLGRSGRKTPMKRMHTSTMDTVELLSVEARALRFTPVLLVAEVALYIETTK